MRRFLILLTAAVFLPQGGLAQETSTAADSVTADRYRIYTSTGQPATWADVSAGIASAQVVFVGENHNDPVAHHIEVATYEAALQTGTFAGVTASLEMFTRDVQGVIDEYLDDLITERHFLAESRPWKNYDTDYRPFVEAARAAGHAVIGANAPRRYINRVTRLGPESLTALSREARQWVAPLPYAPASDAYRAEWNALMAEAMGNMPQPTDSSQHQVMGYALDSQSLWDATMAFSIAEYLTRAPDHQVVHIVGSFHVKNGTGTPEQLQRYRPGTSTLIIVVEPSDNIDRFDHETHHGLGDFVILGDAGLPRSY